MLFEDKINKIVLVKRKNEHLNEILKSQISVFLKFSLKYACYSLLHSECIFVHFFLLLKKFY